MALENGGVTRKEGMGGSVIRFMSEMAFNHRFVIRKLLWSYLSPFSL